MTIVCVMFLTHHWLPAHFSGHELYVSEDQENLPRPEEERITQAEKNKRMQEQLKVSIAR